MRTTVTLDPDVEALIRTAMRHGRTVVQGNFELRDTGRPYAGQNGQAAICAAGVRAWRAERNFRWDKALAAADALEDEELTRKLSLRK